MTGAAGSADRLGALLREAVGGLDRQAAHALLDAALDLAAGATDAEGRDGRLAQAAALVLSRAVAGWAVPHERSSEEWDALAEEDPARWRADAAECMRTAPAVLPPPVVDRLMFGLFAVDAGDQPAILSPPPKEPGYGRNPQTRRAIEQALIVWVEVEKTRGRPAAWLWTEVAAAVSQSVKAVETWKAKWRKRDGNDHVSRVLAAAASFGRGQGVPAPVPDEIMLLRLVGMRGLAENWKRAEAPRK